VKDKHTKALNFMVNMKFNDSCIDFASEIKQYDYLVQFLGKEVMPSSAKMLFASMWHNLWHNIMQDEDDER